ncbi:MAG TPA: hypothetical protein VFN88_01295, partial [Caulobacteraceae bacterium]|nr:hypothetical protein [Caulobacteraceae bacterium]
MEAAIQKSGAAVLVLGLLAVALFGYLLTIPMNWDSAWYLDATERWVHGSRLYQDILEVNPPLSFIETYGLTGGLLDKPSFLA